MTESDRIKYLRVALPVVGLIFIGLWPLTIVWPSGWAWHAGGRSEYLEMIFGVYATLGVFLMIASRDPMADKSLIWFTVWSSFVHGAIMAVQSHRRHSAHPTFMGRCLGLNCRGGCIGSLDASTGYCRLIAIRGLT
jgi:hypothetical protein